MICCTGLFQKGNLTAQITRTLHLSVEPVADRSLCKQVVDKSDVSGKQGARKDGGTIHSGDTMNERVREAARLMAVIHFHKEIPSIVKGPVKACPPE